MTMLVRIVVPLILLVALYVEASSWKKVKKNLSKLSPKRKNEDKTSPGEDDRGEISSKKTRSGLFSIRKKNKDEAKEKDQGGGSKKRSFGVFTLRKKRHDLTSAGRKEMPSKEKQSVALPAEEGKDETPTEEKNEHKDSSEGQHFEAPSESRSDIEPVTPMFESDDPFKSIPFIDDDEVPPQEKRIDKATGDIDNKAPSEKNTGNEASTKKDNGSEASTKKDNGSEASTKAQTEEENSEATSKMKVYDGAKGNHHGKVKSKKEPSEFLWKKKHQKVSSDDTPKSPSSSSDIPFLYGVSGRETFYIRPRLDKCKLSARKLRSDESNTCVAAHLAASCEKRADMDVTVYVMTDTNWESKGYNSTIIESDGKMEFDTLTAHGNPHPDLTHSLNAVKTLYELDTSIHNIPYGRDFFYGAHKDTKQALYVDLFAPHTRGFCHLNGKAMGEEDKILVFPVGRSLLGKITSEGLTEYVMLEGFVHEEVNNPSNPSTYWMGTEGQYTHRLRQCDGLGKWYRRFAHYATTPEKNVDNGATLEENTDVEALTKKGDRGEPLSKEKPYKGQPEGSDDDEPVSAENKHKGFLSGPRNKAPSKEESGDEALSKKGDRGEPRSQEKRYRTLPEEKPHAKAQTEEKSSGATSKMKVYDGAKEKHHGKVTSKKKPSEALWKRKHQKAPSDDTPKSPSSSSDIPFLYGVSGKDTFYIRPKLDTCKLSLHKLGSDESNTCVAAYAAASCQKRADMDVTVYVVSDTNFESKEYNSTIIESGDKMEFDTLTAHGNPQPDLTKRLNGVKEMYELDTSSRNMPYGRDFFYGVHKDTEQALYVDLFAPYTRGFCHINGKAMREGDKVLVLPVGRSLLGRITRGGSTEYLMLEGIVNGNNLEDEEDGEDVDPSNPSTYWMGTEGQYTHRLRQCDDLVKWYRRFA